MDVLATLVTNPLFVLITGLVSLLLASDNVRKYLAYLTSTFVERLRNPRDYPVFWTSMITLCLSFTTFVLVILQHVTASSLVLQLAMVILIALLFPYYETRQKESHKALIDAQEQLDGMRELFAFSHRLHQSQYKIEDYRMSYEIDEEGDVLTKEHVKFTPVSETVYFYNFHLGVMTSTSSSVKMSLEKHPTVHDGTGKSLQVVTLRHTANRYEFAVILDPPCFPDTSAELTIESMRAEVFHPLITRFQDSSRLRVGNGNGRIATMQLELYLPETLTFRSLTITPHLGSSWEIHNELNRAYARLEMKDVPSDDYYYTIFVEPKHAHPNLPAPFGTQLPSP